MSRELCWPVLMISLAVFLAAPPALADPPLSQASSACLDCHASVTPGIVADWKRSLHARTTPAEALKKEELSRKVSAEKIRPGLMETAVGCAECHTLHPREHQDTVDHDEFKIYPVVGPADCAVCHPAEATQFDQNLMSHARLILTRNPVYMDLAERINGVMSLEGGRVGQEKPDQETEADSCFFCHGTEIKVEGTFTKETDYGTFDLPRLTGWPNRGVGRLNPDGTQGSCSACHTRHRFSLETARKPETCSECHKGPDVPAYQVYSVSKHGNIYAAQNRDWDFGQVPWTVGRDFASPTCAACHISLVVNPEGETVNPRTHRMNDRLDQRLMGLVYSAPHPKEPETYKIRNGSGLSLPTDLAGRPAKDFLIGAEEQAGRRRTMQKTCLACHGSSWVEGHFRRLDQAIETTNRQTLTATRLLESAWAGKLAQGPPEGSPFDEPLERMWVEQWLFFATSTRFASAMMGADYGVFDRGRWSLTRNIKEMEERLKVLRALK